MSPRQPPVIIAEIGNNHEGNIQAALELLERAEEAGADFAKFQAGTAEGFSRKPEDIPRYKKYELGREGYDRLIKRGQEIELPVFFSVWSDEFMDYRRLEWFKVAARQCNQDYIRRYAHQKTFISIPHTLADIKHLGIAQGVAMHCVTHYPAQAGFWYRFHELRRYLPMSVDIGFSDHFVGIEYAVEAVKNYGAVAIEKHFTLKHDFGDLRDHALSATPQEMRELVDRAKS